MGVNKKNIKSDLLRLDALTDETIDYYDIEAFDDAFFKRAIEVDLPSAKDSVTLRLDHEILEWFKKKGRGYQTRINAVLKSYIKAHQHLDLAKTP